MLTLNCSCELAVIDNAVCIITTECIELRFVGKSTEGTPRLALTEGRIYKTTLRVILHCFYTVGNDTFWEENDTVQPHSSDVTGLAL